MPLFQRNAKFLSFSCECRDLNATQGERQLAFLHFTLSHAAFFSLSHRDRGIRTAIGYQRSSFTGHGGTAWELWVGGLFYVDQMLRPVLFPLFLPSTHDYCYAVMLVTHELPSRRLHLSSWFLNVYFNGLWIMQLSTAIFSDSRSTELFRKRYFYFGLYPYTEASGLGLAFGDSLGVWYRNGQPPPPDNIPLPRLSEFSSLTV
jgi:hypothetical protein